MDQQLVMVGWVDSAQPLPGWRWIDDPPPAEVIQCVSVGWVIAETDQVLMLAPNIGDKDSDSPQASGHIRIPQSCVTRRVLLAEVPGALEVDCHSRAAKVDVCAGPCPDDSKLTTTIVGDAQPAYQSTEAAVERIRERMDAAERQACYPYVINDALALTFVHTANNVAHAKWLLLNGRIGETLDWLNSIMLITENYFGVMHPMADVEAPDAGRKLLAMADVGRPDPRLQSTNQSPSNEHRPEQGSDRSEGTPP